MEVDEGIKIKVVVYGNHFVGKTRLVAKLANHYYDWTDPYKGGGPNFWDYPLHTSSRFGGKRFEIEIVDTYFDGNPLEEELKWRCEYEQENMSVLMICYSVDRPKSLQHVKEIWYQEYQKKADDYEDEVPIILVGNKCDKRETASDYYLVSEKDVDKISKEIGATRSVECSAKESINIKFLKRSIVETFLEGRRKPRSKVACIIL